MKSKLYWFLYKNNILVKFRDFSLIFKYEINASNFYLCCYLWVVFVEISQKRNKGYKGKGSVAWRCQRPEPQYPASPVDCQAWLDTPALYLALTLALGYRLFKPGNVFLCMCCVFSMYVKSTSEIIIFFFIF